MNTMDRVEAIAKMLLPRGVSAFDPTVVASAVGTAKAITAAAAPELFSDPPTHWLAPINPPREALARALVSTAGWRELRRMCMTPPHLPPEQERT